MSHIPTASMVRLGADATIREIGAVHAAFLEAATELPEVVVDCAAIERADLTFVQLVLAMRASLAGEGRRLRLEATPPCVEAVFQRAGVALPGDASRQCG